MNSNSQKNQRLIVLVVVFVIICFVSILSVDIPAFRNIKSNLLGANVFQSLSEEGDLDLGKNPEPVLFDENGEIILDEFNFNENEESELEPEPENKMGIIQNIKSIFRGGNEKPAEVPANLRPEFGQANLPNSCGIYDREKLYILLGETFDLSKNNLGRSSNIWSTIDGENWIEVAKSTAMGEKWEIMPLVVNNTAYVFGGKYTPSGTHDNSVYNSTDMVNWTYLSELPPTLREYDRSMVYFKNKFWFISSQKSVGIWSSVDGITWNQEIKTNPWDGNAYGNLGGSDVVSNAKSGYISNSLGAYVLNGRIWYVVTNNKDEYGSQKKIYSSIDGVNWRDEGEFKIDGKNDQVLDIAWNTNPIPVIFRGEAWVISSNRKTGAPMVIKTTNGKDWKLVSNNTTKLLSPRYYSTMVAFNNKLWTLGGFDNGRILSYDVWSSINGVSWDKMKQYGVKYPGPAERQLAGGVVLTYKYSKKGGDLNVTAYNPIKVSFSSDVLVDENIGTWVLKYDDPGNVVFDGNIVITGIKLVGTELANGNSSLRYMINYKVYDEKNNVLGSTKSFKGPFYDVDKNPIPQTIKLSKPITLSPGQSMRISVNADFGLSPSFKNITTFLVPDFDFANEDSKACIVYSVHKESGQNKIPGKTLIKP